MRTPKTWKDYELLDCSGGERLERWGKFILIRPDPQVIWNTPRLHPLWERPDAVYHRSDSGGGSWELLRPLPERWKVCYNDLTFYVKTMGFKHTGLFPEQAVNWELVAELIRNAGRPVQLLNLFAYTGAATVSALKAGAEVVHVDASKGMVQWARENAAASGVADRPVRWLVDDCVKFVGRELRRGRRYDLIILDPPSYGRGPGGEVWKLEERLYGFVGLCGELLSSEPIAVVLSSYTAGLSPAVLRYILNAQLKVRFGGSVSGGEIGLPVRASGFDLPCGAAAIWTR